ncbi:hypothetical protein QZH41_018625, partial [Actinostola sp. cb2023]
MLKLYYGKFLANLSTMLQPLNNLLREGVPWLWKPECQQAFNSAKEQLLSSKVLTHYDVNLPLVLAYDASSYGIGAVISHVMENGEERPIAFASRTLSSNEKHYGQIEKEALSLVYGVKKFHQYLYGRKFIMETDHKPLLTILGPKNTVPTLAAARLQRNTPHTVTDQTPAGLYLKRKPRTRLSLLQPNLAQHVEEKQQVEKEQHDQ